MECGIAGSQPGLMISACTGCLHKKFTISDLLDLGFDPNDRTVDGISALMMVAERGDLTGVEALIDHGADLYAIDNRGWSVVHYALLSGWEELWQFLRRVITDWNATIAADPLGKWSQDATAIHLAATLDGNALKFLLRNGLISNIDHATKQHETALCIAVRSGIARNVDSLLEANADTTLSLHGGPTLLHLAASYGHMEIVKIFVNRGADLIAQDGSGLTPDLVALKFDHLDVATFLKEKNLAGLGNEPFPK